ncbi:MAG: hypothetical protein V4490_03725 [Pseudomonadota bacterium]
MMNSKEEQEAAIIEELKSIIAIVDQIKKESDLLSVLFVTLLHERARISAALVYPKLFVASSANDMIASYRATVQAQLSMVEERYRELSKTNLSFMKDIQDASQIKRTLNEASQVGSKYHAISELNTALTHNLEEFQRNKDILGKIQRKSLSESTYKAGNILVEEKITAAQLIAELNAFTVDVQRKNAECVAAAESLMPWDASKQQQLDGLNQTTKTDRKDIQAALDRLYFHCEIAKKQLPAEESQMVKEALATCESAVFELLKTHHDVRYPERIARIHAQKMAEVAAEEARANQQNDASGTAARPAGFISTVLGYWAYLKRLLVPNGFDVAGVLRVVAFVALFPISLIGTSISYYQSKPRTELAGVQETVTPGADGDMSASDLKQSKLLLLGSKNSTKPVGPSHQDGAGLTTKPKA